MLPHVSRLKVGNEDLDSHMITFRVVQTISLLVWFIRYFETTNSHSHRSREQAARRWAQEV